MPMELNEQQQAARTQYDQQKTRQAEITRMSLEVSESQQPTPTQEENDLLALGLMHPDDKAAPAAPEMPPVGAQQAYLAATSPTEATPKIVNPVQRASTTSTPSASTTSTTAPRTTSTTSATSGGSTTSGA